MFDRIDCFERMISVRIPQSWAESDDEEEGTYGFYNPDGNSGTLRLSLFSNRRDKPFTPEMLQEEAFADRDEENVKFFRKDDYVFTEWDEAANGQEDVHMYYWSISAVTGHNLTRRALFSYAVTTQVSSRPEFQADYKMVRECIFATHFMTEKSN